MERIDPAARYRITIAWLAGVMSLAIVLATHLFYSGGLASFFPAHRVVAYGAYEFRGVVGYEDLAAHLNMVRQVWDGEVTRPYTEEGHRHAYEVWLGQPVANGQSFGYAPSMFVLLAPFAVVPASAALLLCGLASAVAAVVLWLWLTRRITSVAHLRLVAATFVGAALFSALVQIQPIIVLAAVMTGALSLLVDWRSGAWRVLSPRDQALLALALFILSVKPHFALTLGLILLAAGAWLPVAGGTLLFALACAALAPMMGGWPAWLGDYLALLKTYNYVEAPQFWRECLNPRCSCSFASVLTLWLGLAPRTIAILTNGLWLAGVAALFVTRRRWDPRELALAFLFLFLLFAPHLFWYDDFMLLPIAALAPRLRAWSPAWLNSGAVFLVLALNVPYLLPSTSLDPNGLSVPLQFLGKVAFAIAVLVAGTPSARSSAS